MATRIHSGRAGLLVLAGALALCLTAPANGQCVGDCDDSGQVDITDLIRGVNIALGNAPLSQCPSFDCEHNEMVPINCLIQGVNNALSSCRRRHRPARPSAHQPQRLPRWAAHRRRPRLLR
jgi:hypothetical protein